MISNLQNNSASLTANLKPFNSYRWALHITICLVTSILTFAYAATHLSIGIDDLFFQEYRDPNINYSVLNQSRWGYYILLYLTHSLELNPLIAYAQAMIYLPLAAIVLSLIFLEASNSRITNFQLIVFETMFVSFPLSSELFVFDMSVAPIALSFLMVSCSVYFGLKFETSNKIWYAIPSILLMSIVSKMYESLFFVYAVSLLSVYFIQLYFSQDKNSKKLHRYILSGLKHVAILVSAFALGALIGEIIGWLLKIDVYTKFVESSYLYDNFSLYGFLSNLYFTFITVAPYYLPILFFVFSVIFLTLCSITMSVKYKNIIPVFLVVLMGISIFSLSFIWGNAQLYRQSQALSVFVAFSFMFAVIVVSDHAKNKIIKSLTYMLVIFSILNQIVCINRIYIQDHARSNYELSTAEEIGTYIEDHLSNPEKPVIFKGVLTGFPENTYRVFGVNQRTFFAHSVNSLSKLFIGDELFGGQYFIQQGHTSVITHGFTTYYGPSGGTLKVLEHVGFSFNQATLEQYNEALDLYSDMPSWPEDGCAIETDEYFVINF